MMKTDLVDSFGTLIVFRKHIKKGSWLPNGKRILRVSIPIEDIETISESPLDGTTLVHTTNGGTIAIEEEFDVAARMWANARAGQK